MVDAIGTSKILPMTTNGIRVRKEDTFPCMVNQRDGFPSLPSFVSSVDFTFTYGVLDTFPSCESFVFFQFFVILGMVSSHHNGIVTNVSNNTTPNGTRI